jgi:hypothetical protein
MGGSRDEVREHRRGGGETAPGIPIPDAVTEAVASSKWPPVTITVNGYTYRTTAVRMGGRFFVPLSAENREAAGVVAGDDITVDIEADAAPREVTLPDDLAAAMDDESRAAYDGLSYTHRNEWVRCASTRPSPSGSTKAFGSRASRSPIPAPTGRSSGTSI